MANKIFYETRINWLSISIAILLISASCTLNKSDLERIQESIENSYLAQIDDPDSYEFIKIQIVDTIYTNIRYKNKADYYNKLLNSNEMIVKLEDASTLRKSLERRKSEHPNNWQKYSESIKMQNEILAIEKEYNRIKSEYDKIIALYNKSKQDTIQNILVEYHFRENNKMGGKVYRKFIVKLTDSLRVINFSKI